MARGETLWGIAREYSRDSGYSINQAMLAMQRKNPEAFNQENINRLKRGAILRMPAVNEMAALSSREAMLEVLRQEDEIRTGVRTVAPDFAAPVVADAGDYQATSNEPVMEPEPEEDIGHLELVPPADETDESLSDETAAARAVQEELARKEEELVNAQQENTYL